MNFDVFISYSSKDTEIATKVCERLESNGIKCWIAPRDIDAGIPFAKAIIDGIKSCNKLLLLFSKNSNESEQVLREVDRAIHFEKDVLVFKIDDSNYSDSLDYYLCKADHIDATRGKVSQYYDELERELGFKVQPIVEKTKKSPLPKKNRTIKTKNRALPNKLLFFFSGILIVFTLYSVVRGYKSISNWFVSSYLTDHNAKNLGEVKIELSEIFHRQAKNNLLDEDVLLRLSLKQLNLLKKRIKSMGGTFFKNTRGGIVPSEMTEYEKINIELVDHYRLRYISNNLVEKDYGEFCLKFSENSTSSEQRYIIQREIEEILIQKYKIKSKKVLKYRVQETPDECKGEKQIIVEIQYKEISSKDFKINIYGIHEKSLLESIGVTKNIQFNYTQIQNANAKGIQIFISKDWNKKMAQSISNIISDYTELVFK